jgi:hypothetical protein
MALERERHRVGLEQFWGNYRPLVRIFNQNIEPACKFWANPVNISLFRAGHAGGRAADR